MIDMARWHLLGRDDLCPWCAEKLENGHKCLSPEDAKRVARLVLLRMRWRGTAKEER